MAGDTSIDEPFPQVAPQRSAEEVRSAPGFIKARASYLDAATISYAAEASRALSQLLGGIERASLFSIIVSHHFEYDPARRETWPTVGALKRAFLPLRVASSRSLDHILARLRALELITAERAPGDARLRLGQPTARMVDIDRRWLAAQFTAVGELDPGSGIGAPLANGDARFHRAIRQVAARTRHRAREPIDAAGRLGRILVRQDGSTILAHLLRASGDSRGPVLVSVPFRQMAERISTTHTHVRHVVEELESLELVEIEKPGGLGIVVTPQLIELSDRFITTVFARYERGWAAACWLVDNDPRYAQGFSPRRGAGLI